MHVSSMLLYTIQGRGSLVTIYGKWVKLIGRKNFQQFFCPKYFGILIQFFRTGEPEVLKHFGTGKPDPEAIVL